MHRMSQQIETLKLGLEALEWADCNDDDGYEDAKQKALTAIYQALADADAFTCRMRVGQDSVTWYDEKGNETMHIDSSNKVTVTKRKEQSSVESTNEPVTAMTEREALKLALEALEQINKAFMFTDGIKAITAIKEALAQPEQEPFCYVNVNAQGDVTRTVKRKDVWCKTPLYTTPPQRTWVGLTDDEFEDIELGCRSTPFGKIDAMRMVEAKLKEKNT